MTDYAELIADFFGPFHDLRTVIRAREPSLNDNPTIAYAVRQALACSLRKEAGSNGIIYPSSRHTDGTCLVTFQPHLIQNLRQGGIWKLEWQGAPQPTVTRHN